MSAGATMVLDCSVEKIEYMVINERKYRVKVILAIMAREYTDAKVDLFEGLVDEDIKSSKKPWKFPTSLSERRTLFLSKRISFPKKILTLKASSSRT